jgi:hypothetical protein
LQVRQVGIGFNHPPPLWTNAELYFIYISFYYFSRRATLATVGRPTGGNQKMAAEALAIFQRKRALVRI